MRDLDDLPAIYERAQALGKENRWQDVKLVLTSVKDELDALPQALCYLAEAHARLHDPIPAQELALRALERLRANDDLQGMLKASMLLGIVSFESGRADDAYQYFSQALDTTEALGDDRMRARIWNNLGTLHTVQEDFAAAAASYEKALALFQSQGDLLGQAQTFHNLGIVYRDQEKWTEADQQFVAAARTANQIGDHRLFGLAMIERAHLALRNNDYATAERVARLALVRFDVHSSVFGLAEVHMILGRIDRLRGNLDTALENLEKAREMCELGGGALLGAEIQLEIGQVLAAQDRRDQAREVLTTAEETFRQLGRAQKAQAARDAQDRIVA